LWLPILAHFLFNGLQIIAQHLYFKGDIDINLDEVDITPGFPAFIITIVLLLACFSLNRISRINQMNQNGENYYEQEMGKSV